MAYLSDRDREYLRKTLDELPRRVKLLVFSEPQSKLLIPGKEPCQYCQVVEEIVEELCSLSDKLEKTVYTDREAPEFATYRIDKVPALVLLDEDGTDYGIRFYGLPSGYEFGTLIEDITDLAHGKTRLSEQTRQALQGLTRPVHIQVFVTPTCPYCPRAVRLAHQMAMESPQIRADMIEANEFAELSNKYGVYGVPKTVINEVEEVEGAVPEATFLSHVLAAVEAGE